MLSRSWRQSGASLQVLRGREDASLRRIMLFRRPLRYWCMPQARSRHFTARRYLCIIAVQRKMMCVSVWWAHSAARLLGSAGRWPEPFAMTRSLASPGSMPAFSRPCTTLCCILLDFSPVSTQTRSGCLVQSTFVACSVGKVWPDWEMSRMQVSGPSISASTELDPVNTTFLRPSVKMPTSWFADTTLMDRYGKMSRMSEANCSATHWLISQPPMRRSIFSLCCPARRAMRRMSSWHSASVALTHGASALRYEPCRDWLPLTKSGNHVESISRTTSATSLMSFSTRSLYLPLLAAVDLLAWGTARARFEICAAVSSAPPAML
mmetsp:Transcript_5678/g.15905  ORF Transcript_5678/g.15905 Transcript_5678/m.15905 type:complete len:322 (-) Transcript_5678:1710-2675(-)